LPQQPCFTLSFNEEVQKTGYTIKQHADRGLLSYLSQEPAGLQGYVDQCSSFVRMATNISSSDNERDILEGTGYPILTEKAPTVSKGTKVIAFCSPNPFTPSTTISLQLFEPATVNIDLFDMRGRKVLTLIKDSKKEASTHNFVLNSQNLPAGVYSIRITAGKHTTDLRAILLR